MVVLLTLWRDGSDSRGCCYHVGFFTCKVDGPRAHALQTHAEWIRDGRDGPASSLHDTSCNLAAECVLPVGLPWPCLETLQMAYIASKKATRRWSAVFTKKNYCIDMYGSVNVIGSCIKGYILYKRLCGIRLSIERCGVD